eukprot:861253-Rhodomonas_salina.1
MLHELSAAPHHTLPQPPQNLPAKRRNEEAQRRVTTRRGARELLKRAAQEGRKVGGEGRWEEGSEWVIERERER